MSLPLAAPSRARSLPPQVSYSNMLLCALPCLSSFKPCSPVPVAWHPDNDTTKRAPHLWLQAGGDGPTGPACTSCGHSLLAGEAQQQVATEGRCASCQELKEAGYFCSVCGKVRHLVSLLLNGQQHQAGMPQGCTADMCSHHATVRPSTPSKFQPASQCS